MDKSHRQWFMVNRNTLLEANVPAMRIVDLLISRGQIYDPCHDDYQRIDAEPTVEGKIRVLLDTLSAKPSIGFDIFKQALSELCPRALAKCVDPADALEELDCAACLYYKERLKVRPLTWLKGTEAVNASTFILNLSMVTKTEAESVMNAFISSSAKEIERYDYLYSRPTEHNLIRLDSLFPQFATERSKQGTEARGSESLGAPAAGRNVAMATPCKELVATSSLDNNQSSVRRVGIYGGAGCGKTSCLMKAASMYSEGTLWGGARTLLLWRLRDPNVQRAGSLKQLLRELKLDLTDEQCTWFADVLAASGGEGVILALDGVDELDTQKQGYIWSLLDGSALPKAFVLSTSRPSSIAKTYFDRYEVNLELLGFSEGQVEQFIGQQLGDKPQLVFELHQVLLENATLASLMLVPLLALMVCQIFRLTAKEPPTTRTSLYSTLLALVVRRTVEKGEGRLSLPAAETSRALAVSDVLRMKDTVKTLVSQLAEVAFQAHEQGIVVFDHMFIEMASCSDEALQLGLLCGYSSEEGVDVVPLYSFQHLTVQEFLVAYRLVTHAASEQAMRDEVCKLVWSRHNDVVLQFFAGLLAESHRPHFFACLNEWLHEGYDYWSDEYRSRLRVCLQCAKESCGQNVKKFPSTLQLPENIHLKHVTAADLAQLSLAVENSQHIVRLYLDFDVIKIVSEKERVSRIETQTRKAMTSLMAAISANTSLLIMKLCSPNYSLFEDKGWKLLLQKVENSFLQTLVLVHDQHVLDRTPNTQLPKGLEVRLIGQR